MLFKSDEYKTIAEDLIKRNKEFTDIRDFDVKIAYLSSDKEKKKNHKLILAECRKVQEEYEWCCPYDFMIIVYEPNIVGLSKKQLRILMRHELKHVGINSSGREPNYYVVPHDIEDFKDILTKYGLDWDRS